MENEERRAAEAADEWELVLRLQAGESAALEEFADEYVPRLYRFALSRVAPGPGREELVCDLVQTALCKALDAITDFRGEAKLFTWLCSCCRNEHLMHARRKENRVTAVEWSELGDGAVPSDEDDPCAAAAVRERGELVHRALDELPGRYATALEWKYLERLPVTSIAQRLGCSAKAAESLLTRARTAFKEHFRTLQEPRAAEPWREMER